MTKTTEKDMRAAIAALDKIESQISTANDSHSEKMTPLYKRAGDLREFILAGTFTSHPAEGTTTYEIKGWRIACEQKIQRTLDEPVLTTLTRDFHKHAIPVDELVRVKKELALKAYRKLNPFQRKHFDRCLIIKPGKPQLILTAFAGQ